MILPKCYRDTQSIEHIVKLLSSYAIFFKHPQNGTCFKLKLIQCPICCK